GAPWWIVGPPVAQSAAQVAAVAAVSAWAGRRARSAAGALPLAHSLALVAALAMAPLVAALMLWLTGWAAVLPDAEISWWVAGCVAPALWLLTGAAAIVACGGPLRSRAVRASRGAKCEVRSAESEEASTSHLAPRTSHASAASPAPRTRAQRA